MKLTLLLCVSLFGFGSSFAQTDPRLAKASRFEKNGWIYIHLQGSPETIGFQHGYLLANEIDDAIHMEKYFLLHTTGKDWNFYRNASKQMFWNKIPIEYQQEIKGIAEGLQAKHKKYDIYDIVALNGVMELPDYYVPYLKHKLLHEKLASKAPGNCSAFIATGDYTRDHKIVMGHNAWVDYIMGERWNIIADIVPQKGNRIMMDIFPGFIESGDDFAENSAGILITETTITGFKGFDPAGIPEFVRAREAEQYANSIPDFVRIMTKGNNGGYANDWLVGDTKTNEIARLELGLKHFRVWKTKNGIYVGSNFPSDPTIMKDETDFNPAIPNSSPNNRKYCWTKLAAMDSGKIDAQVGMAMESNSYNFRTGAKEENRCVIAGRLDTDPHGAPEWNWPPYYPGGTVQAKLTTADLASKMEFWAHMGNPGSGDFLAAPFFKAHPQFKWQAKYLHDMLAYPWTLFSSKGKL
ncbi:MAG TPA: C45 family peptidase [Chitinophagaceae bacterium]|nr:C45 family peptidase [Chitinophagaceae bacterium]